MVDKRLPKRRRKSFSSSFDFDDVEEFSTLTPTQTDGSNRGRPTDSTIGTILQSMRISGAPASAHTSLFRDFRECFPRLRPVTLRFLKLLGRALGTHIGHSVRNSHAMTQFFSYPIKIFREFKNSFRLVFRCLLPPVRKKSSRRGIACSTELAVFSNPSLLEFESNLF